MGLQPEHALNLGIRPSGAAPGRRPAWAAVLLLLLPLAAPGQVEVDVRTLDHDALTGELISFSLHGGMVIRLDAESEPITVPAEDVVRITPRTRAARPGDAAVCLVLQNGDRLHGRLSGGGPEQFVVDTILGAHLAVPFERVRSCTTGLAGRPAWSRRVQGLSASSSADDLLLLSNGDVIAGLLSRVEPGLIVFERDGRELDIDLQLVVVLVLANEPLPKPRSLRAQLRFVDGSTIAASDLRWTPEGLDITCFDGTLQGLPPEQLRHLDVRGARWRWLGLDVQPASFDHTPQLSLNWPLQRDRNALGGRMRLRGREFDRGIGVHSQSVLTFDLQGEYTAFQAVCGLDDAAGPYAHVAASVVVDGETRWQNGSVTRDDEPRQLHLDITGADRLELRVDFGANGDLQDYFDWADAALIR